MLQLIREFAEAEIAPQTILDKDRHIQNLEAQQTLLKQAVEEKEQHIQNVETQYQQIQNIETTLRPALEDKDRHIVNLEAELAAVKRQAAITAELQFRMKKMEEVQNQLLKQQTSLEAANNGLAQRLASSNQHVRDVVHELRAIEQRELTSIREAIQQGVRQQQIRHERIASRLSSQELLTAQLVSSRTWRTLQALGRVAGQVIPSRRSEAGVASPVERKPVVPEPQAAEPRPDVPAAPVRVDESARQWQRRLLHRQRPRRHKTRLSQRGMTSRRKRALLRMRRAVAGR